MCLERSNLNPKARTVLRIGNVFLVCGLTLTLFCGNLFQQHAALYEFVRGICFGLAVSFNLGAFRFARPRVAGDCPGSQA